MSEEKRFVNWSQPNIKDGELTQWNWMVQHPLGLSLGEQTDIGAFSYLNAKEGIIVEDQVQVGSHCSIYSVSTIDDTSGKVFLRKNSKIGSHTTIMPGVEIGENTIVGAHSLVTKSLPPNVLAFGVPAKVHSQIK